VKSTHRHAAAAAGFLALSLAGAPLLAQTRDIQRGGPPNTDTPYILIGTFHSSDPKLAVDMSDEMRKRVQDEHSAKELYVIPKASINATLTASGYKPDSALSAGDLMELAKQLRGERVLDGTVTKTPTGVHVDSRLLIRTAQQTFAQPLPPVDAKDPGDAAKAIDKALTAASKALPSYTACTNDLRAAKYDQAVTDARAGLTAYPQSTFARLCLLSAYTSGKTAPPDSIISAANAVLAVDSTSVLALSDAADAYKAKGDTAKSIDYMLRIYHADPTNTTIARQIVQGIAQTNPEAAIPIIDQLLKDNPSDPEMLRTKWLLQLNAKQYKAAIASGEAYVRADTAAATVQYYQRQIGAAQSDSNAAMVQTLAAKAAQKFPNEPSFQLLLAQSYHKSGQLQQALEAARRAAQVDPKSTNAWLFVIVTQNELNQPDSAIATAQKAVASGANKDSLGTALLGSIAGPAMKKAQDSKARADWEAALKASQAVDAVAPSAQSKFYVGVAAYSVGADAVTNVQKLYKGSKAEKAQACAEDKVAEDSFATAAIALPAGGSVSPETAGQIMNALGQYTTFVSQVKAALHCK
jgi:tetratricopeptide (TPR) repeat protein